jgi:hypothetical protein
MSEPPAKINTSDFRSALALLVLGGYLGYMGLSALFSYLGLPDVLADAMLALQAMVTLILGFYFGEKSASTLLAEKDKQIVTLQGLALEAIKTTQVTKQKVQEIVENVTNEVEDEMNGT